MGLHLIKQQSTFRFIYLMCFLFSTLSIQAQKPKKIELLNADELRFDEQIGNKAKRLIGNVQFKHEESLMFCDSAYMYTDSNSIEAFNNVRIEQGDSIQMYCDYLEYNGNTRKGKLRTNIKLIKGKTTLYTEYLNYDRNTKVASYFNGGMMVNTDNNDTLTSQKGYYLTQSGSFYFKDRVHLKNKEYTIDSDTLEYHYKYEKMIFHGPTTIVSDSNDFIYCEGGWYNSFKNTSEYYNNAYVYLEGRKISGDTLYFDKESGLGLIHWNVEILDTSENLLIGGNYAQLFQKQDSIVITDSAIMMQFFDEDTLFMHADTFKTRSDSILKYSTDNLGNKDSSWQERKFLYAYYQVQFFKSDMQGRCDSLTYVFTDSIIQLYNDPIIWSDSSQLTANYIALRNGKEGLESIFMDQKAFIISQVDSVHFNQIKGKEMTGYFVDDELSSIHVKGNGETVYYGLDDQKKFIGVNKAQSSNMRISLKNNSISKITFISDPNATLYPIDELSLDDLILKDFKWRIDLKPKDQFDIFRWKEEATTVDGP